MAQTEYVRSLANLRSTANELEGLFGRVSNSERQATGAARVPQGGVVQRGLCCRGGALALALALQGLAGARQHACGEPAAARVARRPRVLALAPTRSALPCRPSPLAPPPALVSDLERFEGAGNKEAKQLKAEAARVASAVASQRVAVERALNNALKDL